MLDPVPSLCILKAKFGRRQSGGDFRLVLMTARRGWRFAAHEAKVEQSEGLRAHAFHTSGPDRGGHQGEQR